MRRKSNRVRFSWGFLDDEKEIGRSLKVKVVLWPFDVVILGLITQLRLVLLFCKPCMFFDESMAPYWSDSFFCFSIVRF
jgi:hypothetical protein